MFVVHTLHHLSISLCKGIAVVYKRGLTVIATVSGDRFMACMMSATWGNPNLYSLALDFCVACKCFLFLI